LSFEKTISSVLIFFVLAQPLAFGKVWTVDERQAQQMKDINLAQKSGQLTAKQSEQLRKGLANVARRKSKLEVKSGGKLSQADLASLQSSLDKMSAEIKKAKSESKTPKRPTKK
jgi:hypothetical protein